MKICHVLVFILFFSGLLNAYIFWNSSATQNCKSGPVGHANHLTIFITFDCLGFLCGFSSHSRIFHWRHHHDRWSTVNFDISSALTAIEPWGFFGVPLLLIHGASAYNSHIRGHVTIARRLAVELSLPVFTTYVCRGWDSNTQPSACWANALTRCATATAMGIPSYKIFP